MFRTFLSVRKSIFPTLHVYLPATGLDYWHASTQWSSLRVMAFNLSPSPPLTPPFLPLHHPLTLPCHFSLYRPPPTCYVDMLPVVCVSWLMLGARRQTRTRKIKPTTGYWQERGTLRYRRESSHLNSPETSPTPLTHPIHLPAPCPHLLSSPKTSSEPLHSKILTSLFVSDNNL